MCTADDFGGYACARSRRPWASPGAALFCTVLISQSDKRPHPAMRSPSPSRTWRI